LVASHKNKETLMRSRTKLIAAALVTAALAAGSASVAVASTTGTKPGTPASTAPTGEKRAASGNPSAQPGGAKAADAKAVNATAAGAKAAKAKAAGAKAGPQPGPGAFTAAVAGELHVGTARADAALRPLLAAPMIDPSSREFAAAASSLGVTPQQLVAALARAKQSLAGDK
jgi:hypothetical protein